MEGEQLCTEGTFLMNLMVKKMKNMKLVQKMTVTQLGEVIVQAMTLTSIETRKLQCKVSILKISMTIQRNNTQRLKIFF